MDMTKQLWQPATVRKELLAEITERCEYCDAISQQRLDTIDSNAEITPAEWHTYLKNRRMELLNSCYDQGVQLNTNWLYLSKGCLQRH